MTTDLDLEISPLMPTDRSTPIGCIGAGFIMADCHLVAYRNAGLNPVAIAAPRIDQASEVAERHQIKDAYDDYRKMLADPNIEIIDIAVPPDRQADVVKEITRHPHIRGVLAQKPLGVDFAEARMIVDLCHAAEITLCVNQNMRYDQSVRACHTLLNRRELGDPVLATIDMRAIPHWAPWQERQGWVTCRIMSIHHLDTMRYWFGTPARVFASFASDPRTEFAHTDGIGLYILEYDDGLRCQICDDVWTGPAREGAAEDIGIHWRVEGTRGLAKGTIGWPNYPEPTPSTIDYTTIESGTWMKPRWNEVWFPDAFLGPMAELLIALENNTQPSLSGDENLNTMKLVDACYQSATEKRAIEIV